MDKIQENIENFEKRLAEAKKKGDVAAEGRAYGNLGNLYFSIGDFAKALEMQTTRLEIAQQLKDVPAEGRAYCNLVRCRTLVACN